MLALVAGCASEPPRNQDDICAVFEQYPDWYDYAKSSEKRWGTPTQIQMAFVKQESAYRSHARPPRKWFLFIPLGRPSSAKGYAQIQDPAWQDYTRERGRFFKSRGDMEDALDFVGWYNDKSHGQLGIPKSDPRRLYLAYHEGHHGYRRGTYRDKPQVLRAAQRVERQAREYAAQLRRCEDRFRCDAWYEVWPLCRK